MLRQAAGGADNRRFGNRNRVAHDKDGAARPAAARIVLDAAAAFALGENAPA